MNDYNMKRLLLLMLWMGITQWSFAQAPLTEAQYNELFPYRFGTEEKPGGGYQFNPENDFYTYQSLLEAMDRMSKISVIMERRSGTNLYKVTRIDKTTGEQKVIRTDAGFDDSWNAQKAIITKEVDYGLFLKEGDVETRTRELSAFLANLSQETTGGWATAPGGKYAWGLYFREEVSYAGTDLIGYVEANHPDYPAVAGKSYHGRGPIQLSWNYNYGQVSQFLYGDKNVLLANPERVIEDGALAFQTAIWFWMTPQYPKPSAHDVMVGNWIPTSYDAQNGRSPGFGVTVNIINGGLECGSGTEKDKVLSRIGHYERHSGILGVSTDLDGGSSCNACGCANQKAFGGIEPEPIPQEPRISFLSPTFSEIRQDNFKEISVSVNAIDKDDAAINNVEFSLDGVVVSNQGTSFTFTPNQYKVYTIKVTATDALGVSSDATKTIEVIDPKVNCGDAWEAKVYTGGIQVVYNNLIYQSAWETKDSDIPGASDVWKFQSACPGATLDCTGFEEYDASKTYQTNGLKVTYQGNLYIFNKWWASGITPGTDETTWSFMGACSGGGSGPSNIPPTVSIVSPSQNQVIEQEVLTPINVSINSNDVDGSIASIISSIGSSNFSGSNFDFTPPSFGVYTLQVTATDNEGATKTVSQTFEIKEKLNSGGTGSCDGINEYAPYPTIYQMGDQVAYEGAIYESLVNNLYNVVPGTADHWWKPIGNCTSNTRQIADLDLEEFLMNIYPNPTSNTLNLDLPKLHHQIQLIIYDQNGKVMLEKELIEGGNQVQLENFQTGVYHIKLYDGDKVLEHRKVIKK
ncbi:T9SS type A sorting domain-containing protein [Flammeovirga sp. MY04]|uniref:glycoside hydrolase family 19 protein n=1 Tax=Flammeovirga sp. MY04 TaxID=1191459 RepID=UPI0008060A5E|nr:glycoside hydrolase family 19 protein [Flammeovirga sp. MY04]ANQ48102.1 T9SS type A sorting domain-containing protein [Flammeovirga sp. MY04]